MRKALVIRSRYVVGAVGALAGAQEADFTLRRIAGHVSALASLPVSRGARRHAGRRLGRQAMAVCRPWSGRCLRSAGYRPLTNRPRFAPPAPPQPENASRLHRAMGGGSEPSRRRRLGRRPSGPALRGREPFRAVVQALSNAVHARGKRLIAGVPVPVRGIGAACSSPTSIGVVWRRPRTACSCRPTCRRRARAPPSPRRAAMGQALSRPGAPLEGCARRKPRRGRERPGPPERATYQQAVALAFGRGRRPVWDDRLQLHVGAYRTAGEQPEERDPWLFSAPAVAHYLQLVETYDLQGAFFWRIGGEDGRVWREVPHRVRVYRHAETDGGI